MRHSYQSLIAGCLAICFAVSGHIFSGHLLAQQDKRPLEHEDYDKWKSVAGSQLSGDGKWLMYSLRDGKDATELKIRSTESQQEYSIKDATSGRFAYDSQFVAYRIVPDRKRFGN